MTSKEIRQKYLDFFKSKGHAVIPSASLIPENDPTVLFTTAGMHSLVPYLMGEKHPVGTRLANAQKCIRTGDIDDVGDNRHLTFFEMLGNWSLGDYFKKEAIEWSWEFLTAKEWLGIDPRRLYVTVFMGNDNSSIDKESISIWQDQFKKIGINAEICPHNTLIGGNADYRIFPLPAADNWWGPAGETGPCGPCTEMFYDVAFDKGPLQKTFDEEVSGFRIIEIWNDVFMEFNKVAAGKFEKMTKKNVDTGMGLERTISVLNGKHDAFDNDLFYSIFDKIGELSGKKYKEDKKSFRIIADHLKAATFIIGDDKGVSPSNTDQGYVVRRLIRRAIRYGRQLGINKNLWTQKIAEAVIGIYKETYSELVKNEKFIIEQLNLEEEKFQKTIDIGLKELRKPFTATINGIKIIEIEEKHESILQSQSITGKKLFYNYSTNGFPIEMSLEELDRLSADFKLPKITEQEKNKVITEFNEEMKKHQDLSRTASVGKFKGGLADASEETIKLHTAAHLLLASLRKILGDHIFQKGSNITAERLRFDFSHSDKMTEDEKQAVEKLVNKAINEKLPVSVDEMTFDEAKRKNAMGIFESKYGERVKVYTIGEVDNVASKEICGGPHVKNTSELGSFKIIKEEASSAGVRRIKAILI